MFLIGLGIEVSLLGYWKLVFKQNRLLFYLTWFLGYVLFLFDQSCLDTKSHNRLASFCSQVLFTITLLLGVLRRYAQYDFDGFFSC